MVLFGHLILFVLSNGITALQGWIFGIASDGTLAIFIFFTLSGFVLSIGYIQTGKLDILAALALRRYVRLVIPIFVSCAIAYLLLKFGLFYNIPAGRMFNNTWLTDFYTFPPDLFEYIKYSLFGVFTSSNITYNVVLWTMPIELWGSFAVFSICALVLHLQKRMLILGAIIAYLFAVNNIFYVSFVCGICLAIFHTKPDSKYTNYLRRLFPLLIGLVIYYSCSTTRWGLFGLPAMPRSDTLNILAACIIVLVASRSTGVKNFFQNRLSRYLGSISFPLYVTHFWVLCSFSSFLMIGLERLGFGLERAYTINLVLTLAVCIWIAHLFRTIETFAIRTARQFSSWIMQSQRNAQAVSVQVPTVHAINL